MWPPDQRLSYLPRLRLPPNFSPRLLSCGGFRSFGGAQNCATVCAFIPFYRNPTQSNPTPSQSQRWSGAHGTQSPSLQAALARPRSRGRPELIPGSCAYHLGQPQSWRGKNLRPSPFWLLCISASSPHQAPGGQRQTGWFSLLERGSLQSGSPSLLWPPQPPSVRKKLEEQRGPLQESPGFPLTPHGGGKGEHPPEHSQPGCGQNFAAQGSPELPGSRRLQALDDHPPPDIPSSTTAVAFRTQGGGPGPREQKESGLPYVPRVPAMSGLHRGGPPWPFDSICDLLSSCTTPQPTTILRRYLKSCHEMLSLAPSFCSWRFKQNPR